MKLHYLPKYRDDWQWVASIRGLEEIDVSFMDTDPESSDSNHLNLEERIHVHGGHIECTRLSDEGTVNILGNLPEDMRERVSFAEKKSCF